MPVGASQDDTGVIPKHSKTHEHRSHIRVLVNNSEYCILNTQRISTSRCYATRFALLILTWVPLGLTLELKTAGNEGPSVYLGIIQHDAWSGCVPLWIIFLARLKVFHAQTPQYVFLLEMLKLCWVQKQDQVPRACCILFSSMETSLFLIQSQTLFLQKESHADEQSSSQNHELEVRKNRTCDWNVLMFHCFT